MRCAPKHPGQNDAKPARRCPACSRAAEPQAAGPVQTGPRTIRSGKNRATTARARSRGAGCSCRAGRRSQGCSEELGRSLRDGGAYKEQISSLR